MEQAAQLIAGLKNERVRWEEDSANFADDARRMFGDCTIAAGFVCYCGGFNRAARHALLTEVFGRECSKRGIPFTMDLDVTTVLCDVRVLAGDWALQGLPSDPLSLQNGVLVTHAGGYPLLVDPQGQGLSWLRNKVCLSRGVCVIWVVCL